MMCMDDERFLFVWRVSKGPAVRGKGHSFTLRERCLNMMIRRGRQQELKKLFTAGDKLFVVEKRKTHMRHG